MIGEMFGLGARRRRIRNRIVNRQLEINDHGRRLGECLAVWAGTPRSVVQGFLAGFLLDQARPMIAAGPSPLKFLLGWAYRELKLPAEWGEDFKPPGG